MKTKSILIISIAVAALALTSCTAVKVGPGEEGVMYSSPIFFGHGGVFLDEPVETGMQYAAISTDYKVFPITPQTITEEFKDMIPSDNTPVSFNAYIKVQIRKGHCPELYKLFGEKWYDNSVKETFRTMVRDEASAYKMFELASDRKVSETIQTNLTKQLTDYCKSINLPVDIMQVMIGAITPPEQVLTETKNTAAQNQSILTQKARADAELSRKQAEINKAIADKAYQNNMDMSVAQYLQLRSLEIQKEKIDLIKDHPNVSVILSEGSSPAPVYDVK